MTVPALASSVGDSPARAGVFRRLLKNPFAVGAIAILAVSCAVAVLNPWILPNPPAEVRLSLANVGPFESEYILGGDNFGRDIFSRLIASIPTALLCAVLISTVALCVGASTGLVAGYFGGSADSVLLFFFAVVMAGPATILLIVLYTVLGTNVAVTMIVLGVTLSPFMFLLVRTLTCGVKNELYIDAARVSGLSNSRVIGRHVLLTVRAPMILMMAGFAAAGIAIQAGLEFLGLGDPSTPSLGGMLSDAFDNVYVAPVQLVWPAVALALITGSFTILSISLRDTLEGTFIKPSRKQREQSRERARKVALAKPAAAPYGESERVNRERGNPVPLLRVRGLGVAYPAGDGFRSVVSDASFDVHFGEVVGLVGESGSGKSQTVFAILGLLSDEAVIARGSAEFDGSELWGRHRKDMMALRRTEISYVPQEPMANLDPSFTVGSQMIYAIRTQTGMSKKAARALASSMLERVGIADPARVLKLYPHEISGGMAQRVLIASAVVSRPRLLIADEPTTALDVTVQAEVLDLLKDLQAETGMAVLIVTHNFGVVADLCDRVIVMKDGQVIEEGSTSHVLTSPAHSYTASLLDAVLDKAPLRAPLREAR